MLCGCVDRAVVCVWLQMGEVLQPGWGEEGGGGGGGGGGGRSILDDQDMNNWDGSQESASSWTSAREWSKQVRKPQVPATTYYINDLSSATCYTLHIAFCFSLCFVFVSSMCRYDWLCPLLVVYVVYLLPGLCSQFQFQCKQFTFTLPSTMFIKFSSFCCYHLLLKTNPVILYFIR